MLFIEKNNFKDDKRMNVKFAKEFLVLGKEEQLIILATIGKFEEGANGDTLEIPLENLPTDLELEEFKVGLEKYISEN